ncbi:hypothetical protein QBC34DRAFT_303204 [Podospora aff. communis PSN243]|uniref:Folliculin-interacting protein N-terminal domain-containing protein n=1 Tax=Podospora aff. communis PSN243 TaxID=3040156 RepID=A0AAV9GGD6_9PEZI|nr:hypothetical protein QBC34DRAFT_303204 [Podospora aff. communis PSN243]
MECNFPELLARDLEVSEAVFTSKSMTAGCPSSGLATPSIEDDCPFQGLVEVTRQMTPVCQDAVNRPHPHSLTVDIRRTGSIETFGLDESVYRGEMSDSASESSAGMGPPPVRTREQSFTTAATSVSGRCSSLLSQKPVSPSSSTSLRVDRAQESWFDGDGDLDSHPRPDTTNSDASDVPRAVSGLNAFETRHMFFPPGDPLAFRPATANISHRAPVRRSIEERPHTSSGHPRMERPRLVDIQAPFAVPKRRSSLKKPLHEELPQQATPTAPSPSIPLQFFASSDCNASQEREFTFGGPLTSHPPMPLLATTCGRTVIDASKPPSFESKEPDPLLRRLSIAGSFHAGGAGDHSGFIFDEEPEERPRQQEKASGMRKLSMATIGSWAESNAEVFAPRAANNSSVISMPGIPLPPEVVETLRISIACFPETMLLSSSLSIETIRAYSKKLKHRSTPTHQRRLSEDNHSVFSFSSANTKQASRWAFPKLIQTRRSRQNSSAAASLAGISEQLSAASREPMTPNWTPIKNIFSTGSDYLCDALYAHLVAYNYINVLCPLPITTVPRSPFQAPEDDRDDKAGGRIPKKAASILGLQASTQAHSSANPLLRRINSRRTGGSSGGGGNESTTLRDVQAGLGRCIAFLVATLKQTGIDSRPLDGVLRLAQATEAEGMDPLLIRSLCEVVRCSEESIP